MTWAILISSPLLIILSLIVITLIWCFYFLNKRVLIWNIMLIGLIYVGGLLVIFFFTRGIQISKFYNSLISVPIFTGALLVMFCICEINRVIYSKSSFLVFPTQTNIYFSERILFNLLLICFFLFYFSYISNKIIKTFKTMV